MAVGTVSLVDFSAEAESAEAEDDPSEDDTDDDVEDVLQTAMEDMDMPDDTLDLDAFPQENALALESAEPGGAATEPFVLEAHARSDMGGSPDVGFDEADIEDDEPALTDSAYDAAEPDAEVYEDNLEDDDVAMFSADTDEMQFHSGLTPDDELILLEDAEMSLAQDESDDPEEEELVEEDDDFFEESGNDLDFSSFFQESDMGDAAQADLRESWFSAEPGDIDEFDPERDNLIVVWDDVEGDEPEVDLRPSSDDPGHFDLHVGTEIVAQVPVETGLTSAHVASVPYSLAQTMGWA